MRKDYTASAERLAKEDLLTLSQAARLIPTGRGTRGYASASALCRWIIHGKQGVFLDGMRAGNGWLTSREALARFAGAFSGARVAGIPEIVGTESTQEMRDRKARAAAAMERMFARHPASSKRGPKSPEQPQ